MKGLRKRALEKITRIWFSFYYRCSALLNFSYISFNATIYISASSNFKIGKFVRVRPGSIISIHENATLFLGSGSWIGPGVVIYCAEKITIGRNTRIAHYCSLIDHDYAYRDTRLFQNRVSSPILIGDDVWLGSSVTILKGVTIGDGSIIASSTLVNKNVPSETVAYNKRDLILKPKFTNGKL
jgi:acetyltransferase-like isoleucine patch superfamily enzyme